MRYFRIPGFTGIEGHREDADRGSLRRSQNCLNAFSGGLRSAPVWEEELPKYDGAYPAEATMPPSNMYSDYVKSLTTEGLDNSVYYRMDERGYTVVVVTRGPYFHDIIVQESKGTASGNLEGFNYPNTDPEWDYGTGNHGISRPTLPTESDFLMRGPAYFSNIGDRRFALSDGGWTDPILFNSAVHAYPLTIDLSGDRPKMGMSTTTLRGAYGELGPAGTFDTAPPIKEWLDSSKEYLLQDLAHFAGCKFFIVANLTIFAAGHEDFPMTVFISEPAGAMNKKRARMATDWVGTDPESQAESHILSKVELLMTMSKEITSLSLDRLGNILVHTDNGIYQLTPPSGNQAFTGYRTEQRTTSPLSGAFNYKTSITSQQSLPMYFGVDSQIYDINMVAKGPEAKPDEADKDQLTWKAKGVWEEEHPEDKTGAFAVYNAETGIYWLYLPTKKYDDYLKYQDTLDNWTGDMDLCEIADVAEELEFPPSNFSGSCSGLGPTDFAGESSPEKPTDFAGIVMSGAPWNFSGECSPAAPTVFEAMALPAPTNFAGVSTPGSGQPPANQTPAWPTNFAGSTVLTNQGSLTHRWEFDSGTYLQNDSVNSPPSVINLLSDPSGGAFSLDTSDKMSGTASLNLNTTGDETDARIYGFTNYSSVPTDDRALRGNGAFSLCCWCKPRQSGNTIYPGMSDWGSYMVSLRVDGGNTNGDPWGVVMLGWGGHSAGRAATDGYTHGGVTQGLVAYIEQSSYIADNGLLSFTSSDPVQDEDKWYFVCTTWDGISVQRLYWACVDDGDTVVKRGQRNPNGGSQDFATVVDGNGMDDGMSDLFVGRVGPWDPAGTETNAGYWHGYQGRIDELRLYDGALSEADVNLIYNGGAGDW